MSKKIDSAEYPSPEAQRRFEATLRGALATAPTPLKDAPKSGASSKGGASARRKSASRAPAKGE